MKIHIGPHREWFGPYQLAEKMCFWMEKGTVFAEIEIEADPRIHKFGNFLAHGFGYKESNKLINKDEHITWLYKLLIWIERKKHRKVEIEIEKFDTWGMDSTLAMIIAPMLIQLKETKTGYPGVFVTENNDEQAQQIFTGDEFDYPEDHGAKTWSDILDKMIWAFEQVNDPNAEDQYRTGESDYIFKKIDKVDANGNHYSEMIEGPDHTLVTDWDGIENHNKRMQEGFDLFGKYFRNLWD